MPDFPRDSQVVHGRFGEGVVIFDEGATVVVRFRHGIEECAKRELSSQKTPTQALEQAQWHPPLEVLARTQAFTIEAVNDAWGVFSRSRIALLPHQLWVCHQVLKSWPTRWLVADDVGLGKTIEAGLVLWPLLSKQAVKRLLVLCPASLVDQWQYRLRTMFDIRLTPYAPHLDNARSDYWNTHSQVVASLQTLREDRKGRHQRLLESAPWDLILVDEAHHLNAEEQGGATLGYQLIEKLEREQRARSLIFFTGTPHRGKDYGFLALLKLLRKDLFPDPKSPMQHYLPYLHEVVIRNNKNSVTDLAGRPLFHTPKVRTETYHYSLEEAQFYDMMTDFIATGKAYASSLTGGTSQTVMLILISLQKLASSSVAAVRRALRGRLERMRNMSKELDDLSRMREYSELQESGNEDALSVLEEQIAQVAGWLRLMEDERQRLEELLEAASAVKEETKIRQIVQLVKERFADRSVLFFTEYKATQSLLMSTLMETFGADSTTFINGDGRAEDVLGKTIVKDRQEAAERFNRGEVRFLVSTEAAGEGIDLQRCCHTLIHVDLPWNPMRMHQRVGRINRYGQKNPVEVVTLRNPDTVESRIWDRLNEKIERIQQALGQTMDEPEDLMQLVLGMTSPSVFTRLFSDAPGTARDSLNKWFDRETASFGGQDVLDAVTSIVGHSAKFDYQAVSSKIPRLDLPDLRPFFLTMLVLNHRAVQETEGSLSFITPEAWLTEMGIRQRYKNMVFDRTDASEDAGERILGVGHKLLGQALTQAQSFTSYNARLPADLLLNPLLVYRLSNRLTSDETPVRTAILAVELQERGYMLWREEALLTALNVMVADRRLKRAESQDEAVNIDVSAVMDGAKSWLEQQIPELGLPFAHPDLRLQSVLWPSSRSVP
jgi:ERCC4-related helicase